MEVILLDCEGSLQIPQLTTANSFTPHRSVDLDPSVQDETRRTVRVLAFLEASSLTGPAKNVLEFARRAADHDQSLCVNLEIATFCRGLSHQNEFITACHSSGLNVHVICERFAFDPAVLSATRALVAERNPQIVQTHSVKSHFLVRLTREHLRRRWIAFHHGYTVPDLKMRTYNQLDRWSLLSASKVVTVCRQFAVDLQRLGVKPSRIIVQHNSVKDFLPTSHDRVIDLRRKLGICPGTWVLLNVGRLSREKGQLDLIKAIGYCRRQNSKRKIKVVFVGEGPEAHRLQAAAKHCGVADSLVFAGHQADVGPFYTMADLMIVPSHSEGSPNSLLEAMAAGLPIVATNVGGVPELVTDRKEALVVESNNPAALANAINELFMNGNLRAELASHARLAAKNYSPSSYCNAMLRAYKGLLT